MTRSQLKFGNEKNSYILFIELKTHSTKPPDTHNFQTDLTHRHSSQNFRNFRILGILGSGDENKLLRKKLLQYRTKKQGVNKWQEDQD